MASPVTNRIISLDFLRGAAIIFGERFAGMRG